MFCPRCGLLMQERRRVFRLGSVLFTYGCVKCNRTFLTAAPSRKTMDNRFKLGESVYAWTETLNDPVVPLAEAKRRRDAWGGKRIRRRCVPRFCPKCGALLQPLRERLEKGRPRTVYGCPSRGCNTAYIQPGKYFMELAEVSADWVAYRRCVVRQNRRLNRTKRRVGR